MLVVVAGGGAALAQSVVVFVNGEPITAIDIEQRSKFILLTTQKPPPRQEVLDQLIDEKLKIREAQALGHRGHRPGGRQQLLRHGAPDGAIGRAIDPEPGARRASTPARSRRGSGRTSSGRAGPRPLSVAAAALRQGGASTARSEEPEERDAVGYEYVLRPILFLVPPGAPAATYDAAARKPRRCEAASRAAPRAFRRCAPCGASPCATQVIRTSADLPDGLRKVLDSVPLGELTAPEVTRHGIEMFAVCSKNETKTDTPGRRAGARDAHDRSGSSRNRSDICGSCARTRMIEPGK